MSDTQEPVNGLLSAYGAHQQEIAELKRQLADARAQSFMEAQDVRPIASDVPPDSLPNVWLDTWSARIEELRRKATPAENGEVK